jgi:hypothetical protein
MGIGHSEAPRTVPAVIRERRVVRSILNFGIFDVMGGWTLDSVES